MTPVGLWLLYIAAVVVVLIVGKCVWEIVRIIAKRPMALIVALFFIAGVLYFYEDSVVDPIIRIVGQQGMAAYFVWTLIAKVLGLFAKKEVMRLTPEEITHITHSDGIEWHGAHDDIRLSVDEIINSTLILQDAFPYELPMHKLGNWDTWCPHGEGMDLN